MELEYIGIVIHSFIQTFLLTSALYFHQINYAVVQVDVRPVITERIACYS